MNPLFRPNPDEDVLSHAAGWITALACNENVSGVLCLVDAALKESDKTGWEARSPALHVRQRDQGFMLSAAAVGGFCPASSSWGGWFFQSVLYPRHRKCTFRTCGRDVKKAALA
jgi:hypothetical protein